MTEIKDPSGDKTAYPELNFWQRQKLKAIARERGITEEQARKDVMDSALSEAAADVFYSRPAPLQ